MWTAASGGTPAEWRQSAGRTATPRQAKEDANRSATKIEHTATPLSARMMPGARKCADAASAAAPAIEERGQPGGGQRRSPAN